MLVVRKAWPADGPIHIAMGVEFGSGGYYVLRQETGQPHRRLGTPYRNRGTAENAAIRAAYHEARVTGKPVAIVGIDR